MGGMMGIDGPPHWSVYFGVEDTPTAVAAAEKAGGSVLRPATDTSYGKMAALADPAGASFWIIESTYDDPADRAD